MAPMVTDSCHKINSLMTAFADNMDYTTDLTHKQLEKNERLLNAHSHINPDETISERYGIKLSNYDITSLQEGRRPSEKMIEFVYRYIQQTNNSDQNSVIYHHSINNYYDSQNPLNKSRSNSAIFLSLHQFHS